MGPIMLKSIRRIQRRRAILLLIVGISLFSASIWIFIQQFNSPPYSVSLTAGNEFKTRHFLAELFQENAKSENVDIKLINTKDSIEALNQVESKEVDMAIIQGGLQLGDRPHIREVASLYTEPLHLLVKPELLQMTSTDLLVLDKKRINVGSVGSGTERLARAVLRFAGLVASPEPGFKAHFTPEYISYEQTLEVIEKIESEEAIIQKLMIAKLPDAFVVVTTVPSKLVKNLVRVADYRLIPIPFGTAFSQISMSDEEKYSDSIAHQFVVRSEIPKYTYRVSPAVPLNDYRTLGTRVLLVAHEDVPEESVKRLLNMIYHGPVSKSFELQKLNEIQPEYQLHAGTIRFLNRDKPLVRAEFVDIFHNTINVLGPAIGGFLAIYGFFRWRQTLKFQQYFEEIIRIRQVAHGEVVDFFVPINPDERYHFLVDRLDRLQHKAIQDFSNRYFHGEGVMEILLALISDIRPTIERGHDKYLAELELKRSRDPKDKHEK